VTEEMVRVTEELVEVRLLGLPVAIHDEADQHMQALNREFELIRRSEQDTSIVPHRLQSLIDELDGRFGGFGDEPSAALAAAVERGDKAIDLTYRLPAPVGEAARSLGELLDEADAYCQAGEHLLTLVTPPECLRYRHWFLREFERQAQGLDPTPWAAFLEAATEPQAGGDGREPAEVPVRAHAPVPEDWTVTHVDGTARLAVVGPLDLVSAPALRDVLIELVADTPRVAVDLSGCDFLDSVGLSVLLAAIARAQEHGAMVSFRLSDAADRVLAISGVLERLDLEA
jgi:anti-sigma B factor antagonist